MKKEFKDRINEHVRSQAEIKEAFLKGFIIGKGCTINGFKRFGEWHRQPIGNDFLEAFYWKGKEVMRFITKIAPVNRG